MGCGLWLLVLPHANDRPARFRELAVGVVVTLPVARDLRTPEAFIDLGRAQMLGTAVPEAAIEEDRDLGAGEYDIGRTAQRRDRPGIHPVTQTESVYRRAQCTLWPGIATAVGLHYSSGGR